WCVFPIFAFVTTFALGALRIWPAPAEKVLRGLHAFIVGLIPISLCFWYYRTIAEFPHARVYFIYDSALFFLSDALALLAVILWLTVKISNMSLRGPCSFARSNIPAKVDIASSHTILRSVQGKMLLAMTCLLLSLSSLSVLWSTDWRTSTYFSLHLWLVFLFILSLRDWRAAWKPAMLGFCAALSFQVITGIVEFATQSTGFLNPLCLNWPGPFNPSIHGVSVVQLADGLRILRAYGTTPHPNILGGFALISLLGPASLFLVNKKPNYPALILFSLGIT